MVDIDPLSMSTGPRYTGQNRSLMNDPLYADVVGRMRRAGYRDAEIEPTLRKLPKRPEASAPKSPPSPVAESPAAPTPVEPAPLPAANPPLGPAPGTRGEFTGGLGGFDHLRRVQQGMPMPAIDPSMQPPVQPAPPAPPPGVDPTGMGGMGVGNLGMDALPGDMPPLPQAKPTVTPEMLAAFGGGAPAPAAAPRPPMATPAPPGVNPFQGQQDFTLGPPRRSAVGPNAAAPAPAATAPAPAAPAEGGGFDFSGVGRNILEFGLATMAAGGRPGATLGSAVGEGGLHALRSDTERKRYEKAEKRADRAEGRADKSLSLQERRQQTDEKYRDAALKLQQARLDKDPISTVSTRADGALIAVTQSGRTIDLGMKGYTKPTYSATDAVDAARKLATVKVADGFGGETEVFDPTIYNAAVKGLGHPNLAVGGAQGAGGGIPSITTDEEYNALPSGSQFYGPDGQLRQKP